MDQRERAADFFGGLKTALQGWQRNIWTALPGVVQDYNATDRTVTVQPALRAVVLVTDPTTGQQQTQQVSLPLLPKVPLVFPGMGGWVITFPVNPGDEVLVVFASRCIDAWWQSGGVQNQLEQRAHHLSDGIAIPGLRSVPNIQPPGSDPEALSLRSDDGTISVELTKGSGGQIRMLAPKVKVQGDLEVTGNITASNGATAVNLFTHVHRNVQTGPDNSGPPVSS